MNLPARRHADVARTIRSLRRIVTRSSASGSRGAALTTAMGRGGVACVSCRSRTRGRGPARAIWSGQRQRPLRGLSGCGRHMDAIAFSRRWLGHLDRQPGLRPRVERLVDLRRYAAGGQWRWCSAPAQRNDRRPVIGEGLPDAFAGHPPVVPRPPSQDRPPATDLHRDRATGVTIR